MQEKENYYGGMDSGLTFSPIKRSAFHHIPKEKVAEEVLPNHNRELICARFQDALWLEFGTVPVGASRFVNFKLRNPSKNKAITVSIEKESNKFGLSLKFHDSNEGKVNIEPESTVDGTVFWSPTFDVSIRETIRLKLDEKAPLQIIVHGIAGTGKVSFFKITI